MYYPQHRYEWDEFQKRFPRYCFVQGLYISYDLYEEIEKPERYKTIYVMRDPRDIVVSWYHSMLRSHPLMGKVVKYRKVLQDLNKEDGIAYCIKELALKFAGMRTWIHNKHDPQVLIIKFEDLVLQPFEEFKKIFTHCELNIPDHLLLQVLESYSRESMRQWDLARRNQQSDSHYRKEKSSFRKEFSENHLKLFYEINGNLVETLGYEKEQGN